MGAHLCLWSRWCVCSGLFASRSTAKHRPPEAPCFSSHTHIAQNERPASASRGHPHSPHAPPCAASTHHAPMRGTHAARHHRTLHSTPGGCQAQAASAASLRHSTGGSVSCRSFTPPTHHSATSRHDTHMHVDLCHNHQHKPADWPSGCCTLLLCSSQTRHIKHVRPLCSVSQPRVSLTSHRARP